MSDKKYTFLIFLLLSKFAFGGATDWKTEADIPLEQCNMETVVFFHSFEDSATQAAYAKESIKLNNATIELANKAKNPNLSVGEQLSVEDRIAFNVNRERRITISLQQLISSNRLRDIEFLDKLTKVAYQNFKFGEIYDKKDSNFTYQNFVYLLRIMDEKYPSKDADYNLDKSNKCSFNYAVEVYEKEAIAKMNTVDANALLIKLQTLAKKYNTQTVVYEKLSKTDKEYFDKLQVSQINPLTKARQLAEDIENVKLMNDASILIYKSLQDDLNYSGGNSKNYGDKLKQIRTSKDTSDRMKYALNVWELIGEDFPSQVSKQQREQADYATKVGNESLEKIKKYKDKNNLN